MSSWFTYILRCADGSLYTGISTNVAERVKKHNAGSGAAYTRSHLPVKLIWREAAISESAARKREAQIKSWTRPKKEHFINAMQSYKSIDAYIKTFPKDVQVILEKLRATIHKAAPKAEEGISYGMPGFKLNGKVLVYFAAWKKHIGFYATPAGNAAFKKELAPYKQSKGTVQFSLDEPIPYDLVKKMVLFRVKESKV